MANHKSAEKRNRQSEKRKLHNKYFVKSMRNSLKKLRATSDKEEAKE
ncbi:MAG: 30S ribosomal protein S20, partial [Bacteroidales bacterium]|nr:30S ribosomal protein S20 [Bacteroidales bacterium]